MTALLVCAALLSGCSSPAAETENETLPPPETAEAGEPMRVYELRKAVEPRLAYPLAFSDPALEFPAGAALSGVHADEPATDIDELVFAVDTLIYASPDTADEMVYLPMSDELSQSAAADPIGFVGRVLQSAPLGHKFAVAYDDSAFEAGLFGIRAGFRSAYATESYPQENTAPALSYEFYKNALGERKRELEFQELPLCQRGGAWLPVENSEQLFYALQYGYIPYCEPGTDAYTLLSRCVDILSQITREGMTEVECYKAIYQYVTMSNRYDYTTLLDVRQRDLTNRVFFLEGSVLDGVAVCDGLSKELVVLSRLMGIEAYHIGARAGDEAHAYAYVRIDGTYYLSCPTSGMERYPAGGGWQEYHTNNYMLTDFDTNMPGWEYDAEVFPEIETALRESTAPFDYWAQTCVEIDGERYDFHPETAADAMPILLDAAALQEELGIAVEVELCGRVDVLRQAYEELKELGVDVVYLSSGTFDGQRLQTYLIGGAK